MITIDERLKNIIPKIADEEKVKLEDSIKREGCRDPIVLWKDTIIDGHNRFDICTRNNIPFKTVSIELNSIEDAIDWMYTNQLSKRNLTDEGRTYILGKQYEARKKREGASVGNINAKQLPQNEGVVSTKTETAVKIADEQKVSRATVERATEYSAAIDTLTETVGVEVTNKILSGELNTTKKGIVELAKAKPEIQKRVIAKVVKGDKLKDAKTQIAEEDVKEIPPIEGKYRVILADPPWEYGKSMDTTYGTADKHYPTMSLQKICDLKIKDIAEDNSVLFMWTTSPLLEDSFKVINAWGFKYKASFVWDKVSHVMGHYNSVRHEFLLVATRGSCTPEIKKLFDSVVSEERTEHSAKPETFRTIIDTIYPSGKRVELFARKVSNGWESWGNQI